MVFNAQWDARLAPVTAETEQLLRSQPEYGNRGSLRFSDMIGKVLVH